MAEIRTTRTALIWSAVETFGYQGVQLVAYVLLARLISPGEFGMVAMLTVFLSIGQILADSGFSNALIQKKDDDDLDRSTVFYFNLFIGAVLSSLIFLGSGWIADFYNDPDLEPLCRVMSLMILASSAGMIQQAITKKHLDFRTRARSAITAAIAAGGISVALALAGAGVWALAAHMILMRLFQSVFLWWFCRWRPLWAFSIDRLRKMFGFGSKMLVAGLLSAFFNNLITLVTGKVYSPLEVGYYDVARRYQEYPANNLTTIFSRVSFPAFAREQDNILRLRQLFVKTLRVSSALVFPVMGLLCGVAHPLFESLLGAKWLPSVPLFQVLCIVGIFQPISAINLNCLLAQGKSGHFLVLEIAKRSLAGLSVLVTFRLGVFWMVVGWAVACVLCFFVNSFYTAKYLSVSSFEQLRIVFKNAVLAILVGLSAYACTLFTEFPFWNLCAGVAAGLVSGVVFLACFDRDSLTEGLALLRRQQYPATGPQQ